MLAWTAATASGQWDTNAWNGDYWRVYEDGSSNMIPIAATVVTQAFAAASERATALMREPIDPPETTNVWRWHHDSLVTMKAWVTNNAPLFLDTSWATNMPAAWNAAVVTGTQDYVLGSLPVTDPPGFAFPPEQDWPVFDPPSAFTTVTLHRISYPAFWQNRSRQEGLIVQEILDDTDLTDNECESLGTSQGIYYAPRLTAARIVAHLGLPSDYFTFTPHRALFAATNDNGWLPMRDVLSLMRYELREPVRWEMTSDTNNAVRAIQSQRHGYPMVDFPEDYPPGWSNATAAADLSYGGAEVAGWASADDIPHPGCYVRVSDTQGEINSWSSFEHAWSAVRYAMQATPTIEDMPAAGAEVRFFGLLDRLPVGSYAGRRHYNAVSTPPPPNRGQYWTWAPYTARDAVDTNMFIVTYEDFDAGRTNGPAQWHRMHSQMVVQMDMTGAVEWAPSGDPIGELFQVGVATSQVGGLAEGPAYPDSALAMPDWDDAGFFERVSDTGHVAAADGLFDWMVWSAYDPFGEYQYSDNLICITHVWRTATATYSTNYVATMWAGSHRSAGWAMDVSLALIDWDPAFSYRAED